MMACRGCVGPPRDVLLATGTDCEGIFLKPRGCFARKSELLAGSTDSRYLLQSTRHSCTDSLFVPFNGGVFAGGADWMAPSSVLDPQPLSSLR